MTEQFENNSKWYQDSILIKLGVITVIVLVLLIPQSWIQGLVEDREGYQLQAMNDMTDKWSGSQLIQGPVLMLPYKKQVTESSTDNKKITHDVTMMLYLLPQDLKIKADVKTEKYKKGIYDAVVYNSQVMLQGQFFKPDLNSLGIDPTQVLYDKARLVFSLSDLKGLKNNPVVNIQGQSYNPEPVTEAGVPFNNALQVVFQLQKDQGFAFSYNLNLKGSNELNFMNTGKTTDVDVSSDWGNPQFSGRNLPDSRALTDRGFKAKWHVLYYNRPFPQQWTDNDTVLTSKKAIAESVIGVKLQLPVDQYHKIMRTAKYASLIIILTFASLFLTEMIRKQRIHVFNYILIGAAMVVYYTLLLSFAEQMGYNSAYLISSTATIALIAVFTASLLHNRIMALLFAFILSIFYGFIFVIIQLEELSLLFGSVALFMIVAALMYFSRKIDWDRH